MRRRGLTRIVALVTLVSMLSCEFTAYATEDVTPGNDDKTVQDTQNTDTAGGNDTAGNVTKDDDASDKKDSSSSSSDAYVNERLELRYSNVSKGYTYKEYTGEPVTIPVKEAYVADDSTAELVNGNYGDASGKDAVEVTIDKKVTFKITAPKAGLYNMAFEYLSGDETSILVPQMVLELNGKVPFFEANTLKFEDLWKDPKEPSYDRYENEIVAVPDKYMVWQTKYVSDSSYRYSTPLKLQLEEGENTVTLTMTEGSLLIGDIILSGDEEIADYKTGNKADGSNYVEPIQAERPVTRNDPSIRPDC